MKTDNKQLERSEEIAITSPYVIKIIKELCPEGYVYANRVAGLAYDLGESVNIFYNGALTQDYGWHPFLIVKEVHYEEACAFTDPIFLKSKFDMKSFNEWMNSLFISSKIRDMIKNEIRVCYDYFHQSNTNNLDMAYLKIMELLIQSFKCLRKIYNNARKEIDMVFKTPIGMHRYVSLTGVLTLSYLMNKVKEFNRKEGVASGRHLLVLKVASSNDQVIVSCEKYNKK